MDVRLVQEVCCSEGCGILFYILAEHHERLVSTKRSFYCPNGHSQSYQGESDRVKAIRLQNEKATLERQKNAEIDQLKRDLKKKCRKPRAKKIK